MDQPTPDQPPPAPPPRPEATPARTPAPSTPHERRVEARLQRLTGSDSPIVAWARGWVSRESRLHPLLAARNLDFVVLTERDLSLFSTGFFTRRPRRLVYDAVLDTARVERTGPGGRRLSIRAGDQTRRLWIELNSGRRASAFAEALVARVRSRPE